MKKALSFILAVIMLLGCLSITAFAAENEAEITAEITAADFGYEMVIPTTTTLTEANHENVLLGTDGKVSIKNIKHPTDKVNVVYTVDLTNGNLTDGTNTINATYKYKQGDADFAAIDGTTKVTVYANKTVNDSFVNVTADKDQWDAAPVGTYNATVVFNFAQDVITTSGEVTYKVEGIHDGIPNNLKFTDSNGTVCTGEDLEMAFVFGDLFGLPVESGTEFHGLDETSKKYFQDFMCGGDECEDSSWNGTYKWIESYFKKIQ